MLGTRDGQARYRAAARAKPRRACIPIAIGIGVMAPAAIGLAIDPHMFQEPWFIGMAAAGAAIAAFTLLAKRGNALAERGQGETPARMRVFSSSDAPNAPSDDAPGRATLTGIARRASVEIPSALSEEPCLVFGLLGEVGDADVSDADGGDFDVELPSGERVMISLENAIFVGATPERAMREEPEVGGTLEELLENRCIIHEGHEAVLEEHVVRDGDEVTVSGTVLGGTVTSLGNRGAPKTRVLAGDEDHPVIVRRSS